MASVIELAGKDTVEVTVRPPMVDEPATMPAAMIGWLKTLVPVKMLLAVKVARALASERSELERPVMTAVVRLSVEVTVRAPRVEVEVKSPPLPLIVSPPVRVPPVRAR